MENEGIKGKFMNVFNKLSNTMAFRIFKSLFIFGAITLPVYWLQSVQTFNTSYVAVGAVTMIGLLFTLTKSVANDKNIFKSIDMMFVTLNLCAYLIFRSIVNYGAINRYLCEMFNIQSFETFITFFGIGYGLAQFIIGYLLSRYSGKLLAITGSIISAIIFIVSNISESMDTNAIALILHGILGILCSAYAVSVGSFIRELKPSAKNFNILINTIFIFAAATSTIFSSYFGGAQTVNHETFKNISNIIVGLCFSSSMYFAIRYFFFNKTQANTNSNEAVEQISYPQVIKIIISNKLYLMLAVQAVLFVLAGAMFRSNNLFKNELCLPYVSNIIDPLVASETLQVTTAAYQNSVELGFITGTVGLIALSEFFNENQLMSIYAITNLVSISLIAIHFFITPIPFTILQTALCASFSSNIGHNIPQIIGGSKEKNKSVANTMVGILNSLSMLFGTTILSTFALPKLGLTICLIILICANVGSVAVGFSVSKLANNNKENSIENNE